MTFRFSLPLLASSLCLLAASPASAQSMVTWDATYEGVFAGGQNYVDSAAVDSATGAVITTGSSWTSTLSR